MRWPLGLAFAALAALVVLFGGVYLSGQITAEALLLAAFALACWRGELPERNWRLYAVAGFLIAIPLLQLARLPLGTLELLDRPVARAAKAAAALGLRHALGATVSVNPLATVRQTVWLAALILVYLLVRRAARTDLIAAEWFVTGLLGLAVVVTLYGIYEWHSPAPQILWRPRQFYLGDVDATYVNKNDFAGMVELTFPYALARLFRRKGPSGLLKRAPELVTACVLLVGAVASHSRMGLISLGFGTLLLLLARFRQSPRRLAAALAVLLAAGGGYLWVSGWRNLTHGFSAMNASDTYGSGGRIATWEATLPLVPQHWLLGTGLGTWYDATNGYFVEGAFDHAHNDYLEFALTGGVLFAAVIGVVIVWGAWRGLSRPGQPIALGAGAALAAIALHSLADFNLQIPANAALAAAAMALAGAAAERNRSNLLGMIPRGGRS